MYNYITGEIVQKGENQVVIENNGIGYEISVSMATIDELPMVGSVGKVYTLLNVREDEMSLYGFAAIEEKQMFLLLTSISGVGPKVALAILSGIRLGDLAVAIKTEDIKLLSTIKGLGKKTAERIVLELKDKVNVVGVATCDAQDDININASAIDEATEALISLGISKNDAYRLARENAKDSKDSEEIIRKAFQNMN